MARITGNGVDGYIAGFPAPTRRLMQGIRSAIKKAAPRAEERMSYRIPTYTLNKRSVYFAGFKNHIGLYPVTSDIKARLGVDLSPYQAEGAKATLRFPLTAPIPLALVRRIVKLKLSATKAGTARSSRAPARRTRVRR